MKNKKILIGLSSCALLGTFLIGCGGNKGTDTPKVHVFADTQVSYMKGSDVPYYDSRGEEKTDSDGKQLDGDATGWLTAKHLTDNVLTVTYADNSKNLQYGKDVDMTIEAKDFCLLANYKNKTYEDNNFLTPFKKGYAVPFVGYGNGLGDRHALPLSRDFYTYKQDADNPQKFYLHVNGEAFKHNLVVDFVYDSELTAETGSDNYFYAANPITSNAPAVISTQYALGDKSGSYEKFYGVKNNVSSDFVVNDGFTFTINLEPHYEDYADNGNIVGSQLYNLSSLKKGTDFKIKATKASTNEDVYLDNYDYELSSDKTFAYVTIKWKDLYNTETYEPIYNQDSLILECNSEPSKLVTINKPTFGTGTTEIRSGYGCMPAYSMGDILNDTDAHDSIFKTKYLNRAYRTIFKVTQADPTGENITWPEVSITSQAEGGQPVVKNLLEKDYKTDWRVDTDDKKGEFHGITGETELPYRFTEDGKFVVVCINPKGRTNVKTTSEITSEAHDTFMLYDYNGKSSYYVGNTDTYAKTVSIDISKK